MSINNLRETDRGVWLANVAPSIGMALGGRDNGAEDGGTGPRLERLWGWRRQGVVEKQCAQGIEWRSRDGGGEESRLEKKMS